MQRCFRGSLLRRRCRRLGHFDSKEPPPQADRGQACGAGPARGIQHQLSGVRAVRDDPLSNTQNNGHDLSV